MKTINLFVMALFAAVNAVAADALTEKLQRGLFEEEANRNLDAAIKEYQAVVTLADEQRKVTATALFRLGECYRKLGKTNEAAAFYQRITRDFSEQEQLAKLSRDLLPRPAASGSPYPIVSDPDAVKLLREEIQLAEQVVQTTERKMSVGKGTLYELLEAKKDVLRLKRQLPENWPPGQQRALLEEQVGIVKQLLADFEKRIQIGILPPGDQIPIQRELLSLQRELAVVGDVAKSFGNGEVAATDEEEKEVRRIQAMTKDSPDLINARDHNGDTPLHLATGRGQSLVVKFLLANKADVNARNNGGRTPLHVAANLGHKSLVELFLENGADVNAASLSGGDTPLHLAAAKGFRAVVEVLLNNKAVINAANASKDTPLHHAVGNSFPSVAELLLARGADPNAKGASGATPLHHASKKNLAELLLARGAAIDAIRESDKWTALYNVVQTKNAPLVEFLLANKANPNLADSSGTTPLSRAVQDGSAALVEALLAAGADPDLADKHGTAPLHWVALYGPPPVAEALLKNKAAPNPKITWANDRPAPTYRTPQNYNTTIANGATPLYLAIVNNRIEIVDLLLSSGAPVNERIRTTVGGNTSYSTPLELAIGQAKNDMIKLLLERKADPNVVTDSGKWTPLMNAAINRSRETMELLLQHGAEVNVLSANGYTPLSIVQQEMGNGRPPSPEIVQLLLQHGAIDDLQRASSITVARSLGKRNTFQQDTNNLNRFTLFEAIAQHYMTDQSPFAFPDFTRVKLKRLRGKTPNEETILDLETAFKFADCAKDQWLEWGDLIDIPEQDHRVNEGWTGLDESTREGLKKCLQKKVRLIVKGQTNVVAINLVFPGGGNYPGARPIRNPIPQQPGVPASPTPGAPGAGMPMTREQAEKLIEARRLQLQNQAIGGQPALPPPTSLGQPVPLDAKPATPTNPETDLVINLTFQRLNDVVRGANVIRSSSDLTRVKVTRVGPAPADKQEMIFDLVRMVKANDLWLRDGDMIEVPEKP